MCYKNVQLASDYRTSITAEGAIRGAREISEIYTQGSEILHNREITKVSWSDNSLYLYFTDTCELEITHADSEIIWKINQDCTQSHYKHGDEQEILFLRYHSNFENKVNEKSWNRSQDIIDIIGRRFKRLFYSPPLLYLYVEDCKIRCIKLLHEIDTENYLLYWCMSD